MSRVETYWKMECSQSSMGTARICVECTKDGKPILPRSRAVFGCPAMDIDPGYGGIVRATFEIVRKGRKYPKNPIGDSLRH